MSHAATLSADVLGARKRDTHTLDLLVDGLSCPSCVRKIESALLREPGVSKARLNFSTRRLRITWQGDEADRTRFIPLLSTIGYRAVPFDAGAATTQEQNEETFLLRCMAIAGFASGNLMLFSVPLWSADAMQMGEATRSLFHWIQALIAMPTIAYAGRPFFRSAWSVLKEKRTNMDVPISVALILATLMSLFETVTRGNHAYFDSAVMLVFFLLIGRYLEARARGKARSAAQNLVRMMAGSATVLLPDGSGKTMPLSELREGMTLLVAAGEKIGADGEVIAGESEIDTSLITGETLPRRAETGSRVYAGTINMAAPLRITVTHAGERSLLAEIVRMMEHAEQSQARYVTLADRISRAYTPVVHLLAASTFVGWILWGGAAWQAALLTASTVLIITCPCALGLAVPVVQVLASGLLMRRGILLKSGSALERLAAITHVALDKTGTLTVGHPELEQVARFPAETLQMAASLACHSKHPLSQALCRAYTGPLLAAEVTELPGYGLEGTLDGKRMRLRRRDGETAETDTALELWLAVEGELPVRFTFNDPLREDAVAVIRRLQDSGLSLSLLSGDRPETVSAVAAATGIRHAEGALTPVEKCRRLEALKASGARVLMVGDGLNDAPSLAAATVSMSPASGMDITQNAADIVFQGNRLSPVLYAWRMAQFAQKLVRQNFWLATLYNAIAIPLAVAGYVTPLIAAIAMSSSSLVVIGNALRLHLLREETL